MQNSEIKYWQTQLLGRKIKCYKTLFRVMPRMQIVEYQDFYISPYDQGEIDTFCDHYNIPKGNLIKFLNKRYTDIFIMIKDVCPLPQSNCILQKTFQYILTKLVNKIQIPMLPIKF